MEWEKDLPGTDFETEETVWLPFEEARVRLTYFSEKKVLDKARDLLEKPERQSLI